MEAHILSGSACNGVGDSFLRATVTFFTKKRQQEHEFRCRSVLRGSGNEKLSEKLRIMS